MNTKPRPARDLFAINFSTPRACLPDWHAVVKVGDFIIADTWRFGRNLVESDWDEADFRFIHDENWPDGPRPAVNVTITARVGYRSLFSDTEGYYFRCRISCPQDNGPATEMLGWVRVDEPN